MGRYVQITYVFCRILYLYRHISLRGVWVNGKFWFLYLQMYGKNLRIHFYIHFPVTVFILSGKYFGRKMIFSFTNASFFFSYYTILCSKSSLEKFLDFGIHKKNCKIIINITERINTIKNTVYLVKKWTKYLNKNC